MVQGPADEQLLRTSVTKVFGRKVIDEAVILFINAF